MKTMLAGALFTRRWLLFQVFTVVSAGLGCSRPGKPEHKVVDLRIESDGDFLTFRPDTLTCPTGALVHLAFHHAGKIISARHNWVLTYPGKLDALVKDALATDGVLVPGDPLVIAATPLCDKGETVTTQFVAPKPGDYPFVCSTHPEDMQGVLHITK